MARDFEHQKTVLFAECYAVDNFGQVDVLMKQALEPTAEDAAVIANSADLPASIAWLTFCFGISFPSSPDAEDAVRRYYPQPDYLAVAYSDSDGYSFLPASEVLAAEVLAPYTKGWLERLADREEAEEDSSEEDRIRLSLEPANYTDLLKLIGKN